MMFYCFYIMLFNVVGPPIFDIEICLSGGPLFKCMVQ